MRKALVTIGTTTLVLLLLWVAALTTQPQPFDGWSESDKLTYVHLYVPSLNWRMNAVNNKYFCDTELHILMRKGEFAGIHLPATDLNGAVYACEYWADVYNPPWHAKLKI